MIYLMAGFVLMGGQLGPNWALLWLIGPSVHGSANGTICGSRRIPAGREAVMRWGSAGLHNSLQGG